MLSIFLGADGFTKTQEIKNLAEKTGAVLEFFYPEDALPEISYFASQDLFSKSKIFVLADLFNELDWGKKELLVQTPNHIILLEDKLDKRSAVTKQILNDKKVKVREFILPHGGQLDRWIEDRIKELGGSIGKDAAELLALKLGRDEAKEIKAGGKVVGVMEEYNLWQAENEIKKLLAFASGGQITKESVQNLVHYTIETDALQITNALAEKDKQKTLDLINSFLSDQNVSDQKASVLQLIALLSEQFRNVAMTQDFMRTGITDTEILKRTSWKSGRLYIMKKISQKFILKKVMELLTKLENLDQEIKSSSVPPRVILDLIIGQIFVN